MCSGLVLPPREATDEIIKKYNLSSRRSTDMFSGHVEYKFLYRDRKAQLPVIYDGQLQILEWGNRDNKESKLYRTGWAKTESLEAGKWGWLHPEPVVIPACLGLEKGVWFQITQGIQGILVRDEKSLPHVYILTEVATHYYEVMTRHDRMPVLIDQII